MPELIQVNDTTYEVELLGMDKVEIGDKDSPDFKPNLKLNRWDGECFIKVGLPTKREIEPVIEGSKVKWIDKDIEAHFYAFEPTIAVTKDKEGKDVEFRQNELGGFEFEVILKKKPKTNKIVLDIETQGLKFCYQPELTPEELAEGLIRPVNVVGSYAVYHATRTNIHRSKEDADKYKCGKAFHIYRPKITDATGNQVWGELSLDDKADILTIIVDQSWLDSAVYPVSIDPNFGYEVEGASSLDIEDHIAGTNYTITENGDADSISAAFSAWNAEGKVKCAVYQKSDYAFVPDASEERTSGGTGFQVFEFTGTKPSLTADVDYVLVAWADSYNTLLKIDSGQAAGFFYHRQDIAYTGSFPNPYNPSAVIDEYKFSIYCTYTPSDGNVLVTPGVIAQTLTEYASILKEVTTPTTLSLVDTQYIPVLKFGITPSTLALITARHIPVIIIPARHRNVADDFWDWDWEPPVKVTITPLPDEIQFEEKE